jgi:hypothetical protein
MEIETKELENSFNAGFINAEEFQKELHAIEVRVKSEELHEYFSSLSLRDKISGVLVGVRECSLVIGAEVISEVQREVRRKLYSLLHK